MTIEINGMAHVILTVSRFDVARDFYRKLLPQLGMKPVFDGDKFFYCVGGRTAIGIEPCDPALASERFEQQRVGLHHLCLRARSREDVDRCASVLREMAATIIRGPEEGNWAPGYYYVLFEDPDGIRLEVCFVPGAGLLAAGASFDPSAGYISGSALPMTRQGCLLLAAALTVFAAQPATAEGATAALTNQELQSLIRAMSRSPRAGGRTQTPFCRTVLCPAATHGL